MGLSRQSKHFLKRIPGARSMILLSRSTRQSALRLYDLAKFHLECKEFNRLSREADSRFDHFENHHPPVSGGEKINTWLRRALRVSHSLGCAYAGKQQAKKTRGYFLSASVLDSCFSIYSYRDVRVSRCGHPSGWAVHRFSGLDVSTICRRKYTIAVMYARS